MVLIFSSQFTVSTNCLASWYLQQYVLTSWQHFSFFWGVKINFPGLYFSRTKGWLNVVNPRDKLKKKVEFMWDTGDIRSFKALSAETNISQYYLYIGYFCDDICLQTYLWESKWKTSQSQKKEYTPPQISIKCISRKIWAV